jgi:amino acid adenylation domain-containing protein
MSQQLLLKDKDQEQILFQFNDTRMQYPENKLFHELFEEQTAISPNNIAVIFKNYKLTYTELNQRTNQLARKLRDKGVCSDQIVGLMVDDNSIEMIIGMLGILKAGGAFLPIDPDFPKDRIDYMVQDSSIQLLLTAGKFSYDVHFDGEIINLETETLFTGENSNLERINHPNDLAYVIYTSGSTGKPKGVQIEHTSIVNQIFGLEKMYDFDSSLNHILLAPFTFDPSVQQIFLPLTSGGKLFLVPKSTKHNVKELWEFIVSNRIDIVNTVPSLMSLLLDHAEGSEELHFKFIILAGEAFSKNLYLRLKEILSAEIIINIYGPTEATINTTLYECNPNEINGTIPIGKPLTNYTVLILDENLNLTPVGVPGEICISGIGLARGYLNNPDLTNEKFVANPYLPGEKMYRTGDMGKWTADGNIEFLGRIDYQVKINGMRVELGEIESALSEHPSVQESVVVDLKDNTGMVRLIAYVNPNQKVTLRINELRKFMKERLPDYMVPSSFILMDTFPLTHNGKVDRKALPKPEQINAVEKDMYLPPRDELEIRITNIWEKILRVKHIGVKDEFFDLGGTSLMAMDLFAMIEKKFGQRLPLATIIEAPTIEKLAKIISNRESSAYWSPLVAIQPEGTNPPFFCVHGHRGNVIGFHDLAKYMGKDQPFYGLQAEGLDGNSFTKRTMRDMAKKYVEEIKTVQPTGPYFIGGWCMGGSIAYEIAHLLRDAGEKVALLAIIEAPLEQNYPKRLPGTTLLHRVLYKITDRLRFEFLVLRSLSTKRKISYLLGKIKTRIINYQVKLEKITDSLFSKSDSKLKHSLYYKLEFLYDAHIEAIISYKPDPYNGPIAMFRANWQPFGIHKDPTLGWKDFIKGELELYEFPGHHYNTFIEPSLRVLAGQLNAYINKAKQNS